MTDWNFYILYRFHISWNKILYYFNVSCHLTFLSFYDVLWRNVCKGKNLISAALISFDRNDKISDNPTQWEFQISQTPLSDSITKVLSFSAIFHFKKNLANQRLFIRTKQPTKSSLEQQIRGKLLSWLCFCFLKIMVWFKIQWKLIENWESEVVKKKMRLSPKIIFLCLYYCYITLM